MTQFKDLELIYNEYFFLVDEISSMIKKEEYFDISNKLESKERLLKKLANAKKTTKLTTEEIEYTQKMEQQLREKEHANIELLISLKDEVAKKLSINKKKLKINNAYAISSKKDSGRLIDYSE